ncbi:GntR family transcriptional regulator [Phenylobacterium montanum]|uniref:GntR family transcriptional regulator n=1 Tax=Phenylobacterium montanum TaxID=2823693 RepID=A0A975FYG0_9CAUL|nr:GntR family transcriptional regulator [Caulobacter sp. S6]QUD87778.1 GntR family transcriptional regulator [Caulobacter sp. S6]
MTSPLALQERSVAARLRQQILALIRSQGWGPGRRIPTEAALKAMFGASRPPLREALKRLEQEGVIVAEHGQGRFVAPAAAARVERPATAFESLTEMLRRSGYEAQTRLLSVGEVGAEPEVAQALGCATGAPVLRLERLRTHAGEPLIYSLAYVPAARLPGPLYEADWTASLIARLSEGGPPVRMSAATASAVELPAETQGRCRLGGFGPAMLIAETGYDAAGAPALFAHDYHRGGLFSFSFARTRLGADARGSISQAARLAADLRALIAEQGLGPGDQLPTEAQLTAAFGVSRSALREALKGLEQDGAIRAEHGRGRFVTALARIEVARPITAFESATDMMLHAGLDPTPRLLDLAEEPAPPEIAEALRLAEGAPVLRIERVRLDGAAAILASTDFVSPALLSAEAVRCDRGGSLTALLEAAGRRPVMSTAKATAAALPAHLQARPEFRDFGPAFLIEETCYDAAGEPVLASIEHHKGAAFSFGFVRR